MLFLDLGPIFVKGAFLFDVNSEEDNYFRSNISKIENRIYFFSDLNLVIKNKRAIFFKINNLKFSEFIESDEYKIIKSFVFNEKSKFKNLKFKQKMKIYKLFIVGF